MPRGHDVELWVFKGGDFGSESWIDPTAWEKVDLSQLRLLEYSGSLKGNYEKYLNEDEDGDFGKLPEGGVGDLPEGVGRGAHTLTWAVVSSTPDLAPNSVLFMQYARVSVETRPTPTPTPGATPTPLEFNASKLAFYARIGRDVDVSLGYPTRRGQCIV